MNSLTPFKAGRTISKWAACALALLAFSVPAASLAGPVKGRVTGFLYLLNPVWEEAKAPDAHGYTFREPSPTVRADRRKLYPYIPKELCVAVLASEAQAKMSRQEVLIGGGRTTPVTIVVTPGTELQFKNTDPFAHRLYAVNEKSFNAANTLKGADRIWAVPAPGVYEIRDELTPSVRMWVVSNPNVVAYDYPDLNGVFSVDVEDAGEFSVQAFFAGKEVGKALPVVLKTPSAAADLSRAPIVVGTPKKKEAAK